MVHVSGAKSGQSVFSPRPHVRHSVVWPYESVNVEQPVSSRSIISRTLIPHSLPGPPAARPASPGACPRSRRLHARPGAGRSRRHAFPAPGRTRRAAPSRARARGAMTQAATSVVAAKAEPHSIASAPASAINQPSSLIIRGPLLSFANMRSARRPVTVDDVLRRPVTEQRQGIDQNGRDDVGRRSDEPRYGVHHCRPDRSRMGPARSASSPVNLCEAKIWTGSEPARDGVGRTKRVMTGTRSFLAEPSSLSADVVKGKHRTSQRRNRELGGWPAGEPLA
jgi:hypothetical protein